MDNTLQEMSFLATNPPTSPIHFPISCSDKRARSAEKEKGCGGSSATDYINQIPYDILYMILCLLPMKELVATSSLSTQWRYLWCKLVKLIFDGTEMLENIAKDPKLCASEREKFVAEVNSVIKLHDYPAIQEFRIRFDLDNEYEKDIDEWLQFAVKKKVEILELDLQKIGKKVGCRENYHFPSKLLDPEAEQPVRKPFLNRWPFLNTTVVKIPFLKKLILKSVNISDGILRQVIRNSPNLEMLSLHGVGNILWVEFGGPCIKLKHLEIVSCLNVRYINLYGFDLESFVYKGRLKFVRLEYLDMLKVLDIGEGVAWLENNLFSRISSSLSFIQVLSFNIIFRKKSMKLDTIPKLPNVKNLRVTIGACRDECLLEFTNLSKACPSLETLTIELLWVSRMKMRWDSLRHVASTPHDQLKTFEIVGYYGRISDFELVVNIIENAARLEKILIDTRHHSEKETTAVKNCSKKKEAARSFAMRRRQLKSISLRDDVDLVIL